MPRFATFLSSRAKAEGVTQGIPRYRSTGQGGECPPSVAKGLLMRRRPEGSEGCLAIARQDRMGRVWQYGGVWQGGPLDFLFFSVIQ